MKNWLSSLALFLGVIVVIFLSNVLIFAQEQGVAKLVIVVTIQPHRIVVVDDDLVITKIISNTAEDVRPIVVRGAEDGQEVSYSDSIQEQYQTLKSQIDFSQPGIVYVRDNRPMQRFVRQVVSTLKKWFASIYYH
jgi:hypothetical protein